MLIHGNYPCPKMHQRETSHTSKWRRQLILHICRSARGALCSLAFQTSLARGTVIGSNRHLRSRKQRLIVEKCYSVDWSRIRDWADVGVVWQKFSKGSFHRVMVTRKKKEPCLLFMSPAFTVIAPRYESLDFWLICSHRSIIPWRISRFCWVPRRKTQQQSTSCDSTCRATREQDPPITMLGRGFFGELSLVLWTCTC